MRYERTTRKNTMINSIMHALIGGQSELLAIGAKYFNELANGYYFEYEEVYFNCDKDAWVSSDGEKSYSSIDDFCEEVSYWLSCYYESGNCRHDEEYKDRKTFLKYLEVFKPHCKEKHTKWIPYIEETKFLFE